MLRPYEGLEPPSLFAVAHVDRIEIDADGSTTGGADEGSAGRRAAKLTANDDRRVRHPIGAVTTVDIAVLIPQEIEAGAGAELDDRQRMPGQGCHRGERGIEIGAASDLIGLDPASGQNAPNLVTVLEAEGAKCEKRVPYGARLLRQARVELRTMIGDAPDQEQVDCGEEEVRDRLSSSGSSAVPRASAS